MPVPEFIKGVVVEDGGATVLARVVGNAGVAVTQASISDITYTEFKQDTTVDLAQNSPLTVSDVIFDILQTDAIWTIDSIGYNFKHPLVAAEFPDGPEIYIVQFKFEPGTGEPFYVLYELNALGLIGS